MRYHTIGRAILPRPIRQALVKCYKAQPEGLRESFWNFLNEIKIARTVKTSSRKFDALRGRQGLKIHLGCGPHIKPGWVNIDMGSQQPAAEALSQPDTIFISHDLRLGLPLEDNSCETIYSAHF